MTDGYDKIINANELLNLIYSIDEELFIKMVFYIRKKKN